MSKFFVGINLNLRNPSFLLLHDRNIVVKAEVHEAVKLYHKSLPKTKTKQRPITYGDIISNLLEKDEQFAKCLNDARLKISLDL